MFCARKTVAIASSRVFVQPLAVVGRRGFAESKSEKPTLTIFDTTLRDGEQSPGATMNIKEKITLATQLSKLGVDVCEAGLAILLYNT
eukprot:1391977-Amorphochlora_amoeboformis.AAC.2